MTEQVRQTERNQRAIIYQGRIAQSSGRLLRLTNGELVKPFMKGLYGQEPTAEEVEFQQFAFAMAAHEREAQDLYFQRDLGLLDEVSLQNHLVPFELCLRAPGGKAYWKIVRATTDPLFRERVDALAASRIIGRSTALGIYKTEFAKFSAAASG